LYNLPKDTFPRSRTFGALKRLFSSFTTHNFTNNTRKSVIYISESPEKGLFYHGAHGVHRELVKKNPMLFMVSVVSIFRGLISVSRRG
jgi:hypothetical protein